MNRAADSHEIRPLTGVRGFAAILVILQHFNDSWLLLFPGLQPLVPFAGRGYLGVDLFFILSGFILSYVYPPTDKGFGFAEHAKFLWFRLARIYPNHLAAMLFLVLAVTVGPSVGFHIPGDYPFNAIPYRLTLTHAWIVVQSTHWNYPSWSISAEWFAYLTLFPVCWHLSRVHFRRGILLVISYVLLMLFLAFQANWEIERHEALLRVGCEFIAGSFLFRAYSKGGSIVVFCQRYATLIFVLLLSVMALAPATSENGPATAILLFPLILLGLTSETSWVARVFSTPGALFLGRISYAIYMSHAIAEKLLDVMLPSQQYVHSPFSTRCFILVLNAVVILTLAAGLYFLVEIPSRNRLRNTAHWWMNRNAIKLKKKSGTKPDNRAPQASSNEPESKVR